MENTEKTEILFKYLPISTREQLAYRLGTCENNHIFFPNYSQLNDPLEGSGYDFEISGYAGCGITKAVDDEDIVMASIRQKYKILSLSETCFSPSMWAHYADNFHGICIGYWTNGVFSKAQKLEYVSNPKHSEAANGDGYVEDDLVVNKVYKSFFYKHTDWVYEKEYRIVEESKKQFLEYTPEDVACVILGTNIEDSICTFLAQSIPKSIRIYRAKIGYRSFGIDLYPFENKIEYDGTTMKFIRNLSELTNELKAQKPSLIGCR